MFIPELWSRDAVVARESRLVFAPLVNPKYKAELKFGDILNLPNISHMSARTKAKSSNAAITYETVTETNQQITVATWSYAALAVEDIIDVQADRDLAQAYSGRMGYAIALAVDDTLAGLPDDVSNTVGSLAVPLTDDNILRAIQYLDDADAPAEGRAFVISPAEAVSWLKMDKYVHNDYAMLHAGENFANPAMERGYVTSFYGTPVYKSTNVEGTNGAGHDNVLLQTEWVALVMQMMPTTKHQYDIDYLVDKVVVEQLYGTKEVRADHAVYMKGA